MTAEKISTAAELRQSALNDVRALLAIESKNKTDHLDLERRLKLEQYSSENKLLVELNATKDRLAITEHALKTAELKSDLICVICVETNRSVLFEPCYHLSCCTKCANQIITCPICRRKIERRQQIHIN
jgi:hypothetical protein